MRKLIKTAGCALFALVLCASMFGRYHPVSLDKEKPLLIEAEIKGEVSRPGVYELKNGAQIKDLIEEAGGLSEKGDDSALSLMESVEDGQLVVVPEIRSENEPKLISINTATLEELDQLPGIGPATAARIIEYRESSPFTSLEQIMEVKGIKEKLFEKIREHICL